MTSKASFCRNICGLMLYLVASLASVPAVPAEVNRDVGTSGSGPANLSQGWDPTRNISIRRNWGIEIIGVQPVSSGYMLEFKYRVLDPTKARILNDRKVKAFLIDDITQTVLSVPAMENVGELRQGVAQQVDRTYFMIFGNPGKLVKTGGKVTIVAGDFRVEGLVVR